MSWQITITYATQNLIQAAEQKMVADERQRLTKLLLSNTLEKEVFDQLVRDLYEREADRDPLKKGENWTKLMPVMPNKKTKYKLDTQSLVSSYFSCLCSQANQMTSILVTIVRMYNISGLFHLGDDQIREISFEWSVKLTTLFNRRVHP